MVTPHRAYAMLIVVMLLWSSGIIVARSVHEMVTPIDFSFWRWFATAALLSPIALRRIQRHQNFPWQQLPRVALLGLYIAGGSTLIIVAVVAATQPTITALVA